MKWTLTDADLNLAPHASTLYEVFRNAEDLELKIPLDDIGIHHRLKNDLGMDSIQLVSILYELDVNYPQLNEQMISEWKTIRDILVSMSEGK